jgi:hypothetical protein
LRRVCFFLGLTGGKSEALRKDEDGQERTVLVGGFTLRVKRLVGFVLVLLEVFNC